MHYLASPCPNFLLLNASDGQRIARLRDEDQAYYLLGIFDVYLPLIYGEGDNAFIRLKEQIDKSSSS